MLPNFLVQENVKGWGPTQHPSHFSHHTFAPFAKEEKVGKIADWTQQTKQKQTSSTQSAVGYVHEEDESTFNLVFSKKPVSGQAKRWKPQFKQTPRNLHRQATGSSGRQQQKI